MKSIIQDIQRGLADSKNIFIHHLECKSFKVRIGIFPGKLSQEDLKKVSYGQNLKKELSNNKSKGIKDVLEVYKNRKTREEEKLFCLFVSVS